MVRVPLILYTSLLPAANWFRANRSSTRTYEAFSRGLYLVSAQEEWFSDGGVGYALRRGPVREARVGGPKLRTSCTRVRTHHSHLSIGSTQYN